MGNAGCCGEIKEINNKVTTISVDKKILSDQIYKWLGNVMNDVGPRQRFQGFHFVQIIDYHNAFFGTHMSSNNLNDIKQAFINLKALYHQIRRGEIQYEDPSLSIEETKSIKVDDLNKEIYQIKSEFSNPALDRINEILADRKITVDGVPVMQDDVINKTDEEIGNREQTSSITKEERLCKGCGKPLHWKSKKEYHIGCDPVNKVKTFDNNDNTGLNVTINETK